MANEPKAPMIIVKDGVLPSSFDAEMRQREANAHERRKYQDAQANFAQQSKGGAEVAGFRSHRMLTQDAPRLILFYKKFDRECLSEVTWVAKQDGSGEMESMFTLVCPRCLSKGIPQGEAQLMVRDSHRHFWIDDRPENKRPKLVDMFGVPQLVTPAGKVTTQGPVRCSNFGCGWSAQVTDSIVEELS